MPSDCTNGMTNISSNVTQGCNDSSEAVSFNKYEQVTMVFHAFDSWFCCGPDPFRLLRSNLMCASCYFDGPSNIKIGAEYYLIFVMTLFNVFLSA